MRESRETARKPLPGQRSFLRNEKGRFIEAQPDKPVKRTESANAMQCPECNQDTRVRCTRPPFRYRQCMSCGFSYRTQEVYQAHADALLGLVRTTMKELRALGIKPATSES